MAFRMTRLRNWAASPELEGMVTREKITDGANECAIDETIAGTAPGIPDDALLPGQELPEPPSDDEVARIAEKLGAPAPESQAKSDGE